MPGGLLSRLSHDECWTQFELPARFRNHQRTFCRFLLHGAIMENSGDYHDIVDLIVTKNDSCLFFRSISLQYNCQLHVFLLS